MELGYALIAMGLFLSFCASDGEMNNRRLLEPYDFLFDTAVEAYVKGDWLTVILNMEKALKNKATVRNVKAQCRLTCANYTTFGEPVADSGIPIPGAGSVEDLGFFQKILKRADCVNSCEAEKLGLPNMHKVSEEVPNVLNKAVAAAHTFFQANPDHTEMRQNLEYYKMMAGVLEEDFKDLEARSHMAKFLQAKSFYSHESFGLAAEQFEMAVDEYFPADNECRALCEGAYNYDGYNYMEYSADLFQSMTDHYMQVLNCKQHCSVELASTAGRDKPFEDFLASHFDYLQFSYYNSEKYDKAIECAKTYLLFHPDDVVMKQNLAYYSVVLGEDKAETISARQEVKGYIQRSILEKELLYFGYESFGITFVDPDTWTPADVMPKKLRDKQKAEKETAARITQEIGNLMKEIETLVEEKKKDSSNMAKVIAPQDGAVLYDNVKVTMTSQQLNGSQRVLLDGLITDDECKELHDVNIFQAAQKGDGYRAGPSPHSPNESFQGVTLLKALGQEGKVQLKSARLFFEISERVKKVLESYFALETPLYFAYSHLVCRTAITGESVTVILLLQNHPLHQSLTSAFLYSAILYLNQDFEGGDFIFTELDAKTVTAEVRPQCGRVIGFGAGKENPHGVKAVTKGQRCAVALWFTLDPAHEEKVWRIFQNIKEATQTSAPEASGQPAQDTADKNQGEKAAEQNINKDTDKVTDTPVNKTHTKPVKTTKTTATKAKGAVKAKTKTGEQAKDKGAGKDKAVVMKGGKQTGKPQAKKAEKKDAKAAVKKTVTDTKNNKKAKADDTVTSDSHKDKEEL
uniref:procollagen-proline 3-dioxygenase n=1 Tax=Cynoglossus semilaevis TaxID=244447 RepID=A0A3P8WJ50_CYNSE